MFDMCIVGGDVVDGSGSSRVRADVGVRDGRIAAIGVELGEARETINASGMIVCPGFVDSHTHLDAQIFWDPTASPSPLHGVTTAIGGNCGFGIAPLHDGSTDYVRRMLAHVEGMPLDALEQGVPWNWGSFGDWLNLIDSTVAINVGFLVGHSTLRRAVMGERATSAVADDGERHEMSSILRRAVEDGALGLSTARAVHLDGVGNPVPSRWADPEELYELASVLRTQPGTSLAMTVGTGPFSPETTEFLATMSAVAERTVNWNAMLVHTGRIDALTSELGASDVASSRRAKVVAQVVAEPRRFYFSFHNGFMLERIPGWAPLFSLTESERLERLRLQQGRQSLRVGLEDPTIDPMVRGYAEFEGFTVVDSPSRPDAVGLTIREAASSVRQDAFDYWIDMVCEDQLDTIFMPKLIGDDDESWALRAEVFLDHRTVIGASDAGAHLDVASSFTYTSSLLASAVRDRGLLTLEAAIQQLTDVPARLMGLCDRGLVKEGWAADLVVFDPALIGPRAVEVRRDLPGGGRRLFAGANGISHVLVNGAVVASGGEMTAARPGRVLRAGRDVAASTL